MIGETAGSYRIVSKLSEGGMGAVYRAEHVLLGKPAAIKVLLPELSHNRDIVARFFNEAKAATAVRHPGIVEIFDFGYLPTGMAYLVMELLEGEPLSRRIKRVGRMHEAEAASLVRVATTALAAAHAHGVVHRDLKPDNIFLVPDAEMPSGERPKLLDFGIAKLGGTGVASASMTRTGAVLGTPTYMSPEQCRGAGEVDHRADLYALGCILYELITGRPPFVSDAPGDSIAAHIVAAVEPPSRHAPVSPELEAIIVRLLAKRPGDWFATAGDLAAALATLPGGGPSSRTPIQAQGGPTTTGPRTPYGHATRPAPGSQPGVSGSSPGLAPGSYADRGETAPGDAPTQIAGAAPTVTTLGAAAGPASTPPRRGRGAVIASVAAVAAVAGVAAVLMLGGDGQRDRAPAAAERPPAASAPAVEPAAPPTAPTDVARPEVAPSTGSGSAVAEAQGPLAPVPTVAPPTPVEEPRAGSGSSAAASKGAAKRPKGRNPGGKKPGAGSSAGAGSSSPVFDDI